MTASLRKLTIAAERMGTGDFDHKVYVMSGDEIGALARAFNRMADQLGYRFARLEEDGQLLRAARTGSRADRPCG